MGSWGWARSRWHPRRASRGAGSGTKHRKDKIRHQGSLKGTLTSRSPKKTAWVNKVRALRWRLTVARDRNEVTKENYTKFYRQIKGGQVRDVKRLLEMIKESKK